ncbi:response regulator [Sutcliffiella horikoshii]|uniref:response regulator n=1 Tax=Sutcliffiella horikoshii TaxID=79883 RepID=UPI001CFCEF8A|nr:response regulator [Sutcliffiella horikoshii]
MWKAVIIDDDRQILRIMKKAVPWEQLSISCLGEAADGEEGLRLIEEYQPDIVITDIYMPIMNGIEMLQKCRDIGFKGKVIILSGFSDFEYARTALRLNVHDYLSKPVSMDTIKTVLNGVIKELEEEKSTEALKQNLTKQLEQYQFLLREINDSPEALRTANEIEPSHRIREFSNREESLENPIAYEFVRPVSFYQEISEAIKHNQYESALEVLKEFVRACREKKPYSLYHWKQIGKETWIITTFSLHDNGINYTELFEEKQIERQIESLESAEQFEKWLSQILLNVLEHLELNDKENRRHKQAVDYMIQYIYENYEKNITLNDLSEQVFISRNYLSQIFKKATGDSFNNYLTKVRMEKAKQMILEGNLLIYEIAEKVGFKNTPYFSSLFKKYMGVNPTDLLKK